MINHTIFYKMLNENISISEINLEIEAFFDMMISLRSDMFENKLFQVALSQLIFSQLSLTLQEKFQYFNQSLITSTSQLVLMIHDIISLNQN